MHLLRLLWYRWLWLRLRWWWGWCLRAQSVLNPSGSPRARAPVCVPALVRRSLALRAGWYVFVMRLRSLVVRRGVVLYAP